MKRKISGNNGGFTLIEVVVAITVLALVAAPVGGALAVSGRVNAYADRVLQARLNVSAVAETLMQEGIDANKKDPNNNKVYSDTRFKDCDIEFEEDGDLDGLFSVTIKSTSVPSVTITTRIRAAGTGDGGGAG